MSLYKGSTPARVYLGDMLASAVYKGVTKIWQRDPTYVDVPTSTTLTAPAYAALADLGVIGGGGGGATADNGASTSNGEGGNASAWVTQTIAVKPGDTLTFTIGNGGAGGSGGVKKSGTAGQASSVTGPGLSLTAPGGTPGVGSTSNDDVTGHGASAAALAGATFPGGTDVGASTTGTPPGGGGGGSAYKGWFQTPANAAAGAAGAGRVRWRSY